MVATPLCILVFLLSSGFFSAWDGHVVGYRPGPVGGPPPAVLSVLVMDKDRAVVEASWPTELVGALALQERPFGIPPVTIPEDAPTTFKARFSMIFRVDRKDGDPQFVPTTSPRALGAAGFVVLLVFVLNNLATSRTPWSWQPAPERPTEDDGPEGPSGAGGSDPRAPTAASAPRRPAFGPPPGRRRRGFGKR